MASFFGRAQKPQLNVQMDTMGIASQGATNDWINQQSAAERPREYTYRYGGKDGGTEKRSYSDKELAYWKDYDTKQLRKQLFDQSNKYFEENKYKIQTANTQALTSNMKTDETPRVESDVTTGASAGAMDKVSAEVSGATGKKRKASMSASLGL